jgi:hypothetical protein
MESHAKVIEMFLSRTVMTTNQGDLIGVRVM